MSKYDNSKNLKTKAIPADHLLYLKTVLAVSGINTDEVTLHHILELNRLIERRGGKATLDEIIIVKHNLREYYKPQPEIPEVIHTEGWTWVKESVNNEDNKSNDGPVHE